MDAVMRKVEYESSSRHWKVKNISRRTSLHHEKLSTLLECNSVQGFCVIFVCVHDAEQVIHSL